LAEELKKGTELNLIKEKSNPSSRNLTAPQTLQTCLKRLWVAEKVEFHYWAGEK
jgi:hypothetical protein